MTNQIDDDLSRILKEIDAVRARRPNGYATRCERCRFWEADKHIKGLADEDQEGECHRHGPRIPHHSQLVALGMIAWAVEELANIEHDEDFDYRFDLAETPIYDWPRICAHDWCGEFQERVGS